MLANAKKASKDKPNDTKAGGENPSDADPKQLPPDVAVDPTPVASILIPRTWTGPATSRSFLGQ